MLNWLRSTMSELKVVEELFKGRHFDRGIVILCVRWYLRYKLSLRDLVEMIGRARPVDGAYDHHALGATLVSPRAGLAANSGAPGRDLASAPRMEKFLKLRSQDD